MAMLESGRLERVAIVCDELALGVRDVLDDDLMSECLEIFADSIYRPMPGRPGWVDVPAELEVGRPGWFDALRWSLMRSGGWSSELVGCFRPWVFAGLGGFAGCSQRWANGMGVPSVVGSRG